jgi:RecA/RadA recombinase
VNFTTGVPRLDSLLSGGVQPGLCIITGPPASGKTTLASSFLREASLRGDYVAYMSPDGSVERNWIRVAGPIGNCLSAQPFTSEAVFEAAAAFMVHGIKVIVIDSISMLSWYGGGALLSERREYAEPGGRARMITGGLRQLHNMALASGSLVIVTAQIRSNLASTRGGMRIAMPTTAAMNAHTILSTDRINMHSSYGEFAYLQFGIKVTKCQFSPPGGKTSAFLMAGIGINRYFETLRFLTEEGVLVRAGAYWKGPNGISIGPGYMEAVKQLRDIPELHSPLTGKSTHGSHNHDHT